MERPRRRTSSRTEPQAEKKSRTAHDSEEPSFDYEADLAIDPNYLDAEFLNHSELFMKYAKESSRAKMLASLAEEKVKTLRSQLVKQANEYPDTVLGKNIKPTAANVEAYYRDHEEYKEVKNAWIEAVYYADLMSNAVFAFQSRKTALENLVRLYASEYNSGPSEPRDLPEAARRLTELKEDLVEQKIRNRMKRGRED